MILKMWEKIGLFMFWFLWPVWFLYFKFSGTRSRVLVIVEDEMLVVRSWLGGGTYSLPGGGTKKHETTLMSAIRELYEETGIKAAESSLTRCGKRKHKSHGLRYTVEYFVLNLPKKPELKLAKPEILSACWVPKEPLVPLKYSDDVLHVLKRYRPLTQVNLL